MTPPTHPAPPQDAPGWSMPGPLVLRLVLVAVLAVGLSGAVSAWLVTRASGQEAMRRVVSQQTDEVEVVARLLASKIEQSQKVLRTVAAGITPAMLESPSALEWLLQQGLPAVQFFDAMQVARDNGELRLNLRGGRLDKASNLDPAERDALRRTLIDGKPLVSELIAGRTSDARVMFTMPLHREDGTVLGVVAGALRLQSQGLLPPSMTLPARDDSRLLVFTRDGTILSHSDPTRIMGKVSDEMGLAPVYSRWLEQAQPVVGRGTTHLEDQHIVSMAGMPLPQWIVARVSPSQALLAPLQGAQREAWWLAAASMALCMLLVAGLMAWMAQPLAQLTHSARQLLRRSTRAGPPQATVAWPRAGGEVGELVQVFQGMVQQGSLQQQHKATLDGQFQAVLDSASVGIVISRHGILEVVSRQACLMLGYTEGELQGHPARTLYANDAEYGRIGERVQAEFAAHGAFDGDVCFMRKDGTPVWARVQGRGVRPDEMAGGTVWILEDITAAREAQMQQAWERTHDALTQLYNRNAFDERLGLLLAERSMRPRAPDADSSEAAGDGVVLFLDLDHFTVVNDIAGHDAGDDVLRHVARLLESQVRQIGWAARLGGDEFAVVLPGCALARGQAVAEQLRASVQAWEPSYQGRSFTLGVSIGLVVLDASLQDVPSVLYAADMACYDAKRAGRNRVETRHASQATASGRMALGAA
ncbi:diguanylate cyclase [Acidovorax sp. JMULE5]|uniref:sensor domain-containing diguanylate cyclase n=1 Tax=Acidovorax sp. JMULE5 TaxID=2518343 RepID=UPI0015A20F50|nr:diguanylate cyclase [Acidovorax sp. JMULE5]QLA81031.1 diguanylate cyclase [Acidovorax sp. JMULE5]